jgi:formate dehydrogenase assembly factor FdhD
MTIVELVTPRARAAYPELGQCVKDSPCLVPKISLILEDQIVLGIVRSERRITRWETQREEAHEKGDREQEQGLIVTIAQEETYIEDLNRISELVRNQVCGGAGSGKAKKKAPAEKKVTVPGGTAVKKETVKKVAKRAAEKESGKVTKVPGQPF